MRAQIGVGSLLIFLATMVVAVLAATVYITTASALQQKAFAVGAEAKERVSATMDVESVTGYKGEGTVTYYGTNVTRYVENVSIVVKLAPGADPIKLDEEATTLQIITPHWQDLAVRLGGYAISVHSNESWPSMFCADPACTQIISPEPGKFYIWINQSVNRDGIWPVLSPGELYTFVIPLDKSAGHIIPEEEEITVKFVSRTGMSSMIKFRAPNVIKDPIVQLYP